jgi:hypothetical protein
MQKKLFVTLLLISNNYLWCADASEAPKEKKPGHEMSVKHIQGLSGVALLNAAAKFSNAELMLLSPEQMIYLEQYRLRSLSNDALLKISGDLSPNAIKLLTDDQRAFLRKNYIENLTDQQLLNEAPSIADEKYLNARQRQVLTDRYCSFQIASQAHAEAEYTRRQKSSESTKNIMSPDDIKQWKAACCKACPRTPEVLLLALKAIDARREVVLREGLEYMQDGGLAVWKKPEYRNSVTAWNNAEALIKKELDDETAKAADQKKKEADAAKDKELKAAKDAATPQPTASAAYASK